MNIQNNNEIMLQQITDLLKKTTEMSYYLDLLKIVSSEYLIIISIRDTPGDKMSASIIQKIHELGFTKFDNKLWHMYAGIIYKSAVLLNKPGEKPEIPVHYECDINECHINIISESFNKNNVASISINEKEYALNHRGVNIVVYEAWNHTLIDSVSFDSHDNPYGKFTRKDQKTVICSTIDIESTIVQLNNKLDNLAKTVAMNDYKMNFIYWNQSRINGETSLDVKKRFFRSLQTEDYEMSVLQKAEYLLLLEFGKICDQNGIDYWLNFGTLLGAVRHNGFIPWDDDMDVGMLRKDLPKLEKAISEADTFLQISNYFMIDHNVCNIYRLIFKEPILKQFLDIFIYDNCDGECNELWKKYRKNRDSYVHQLSKFRPVPIADPSLDYWEQRRVIDQSHVDTINEVTKNFIESETTENGEYIIWAIDNFSYYRGRQAIYKTSDIFPLKKIEFNGRLYNVPNKYDKYLEAIYGDIYTLPNDMLRHKHIKRTSAVIEKSIEMIEKYSDDQK